MHCPSCERDLPVTDFYKHRFNRSGYYSHCKSCVCSSARNSYTPVERERVFREEHRLYLAGRSERLLVLHGRLGILGRLYKRTKCVERLSRIKRCYAKCIEWIKTYLISCGDLEGVCLKG